MCALAAAGGKINNFLPPGSPLASKHKNLKKQRFDSNGLVFGGGKDTPFSDKVSTASGSADSRAIDPSKLSLGVGNNKKNYVYRGHYA